jgi:hypothetical protein
MKYNLQKEQTEEVGTFPFRLENGYITCTIYVVTFVTGKAVLLWPSLYTKSIHREKLPPNTFVQDGPLNMKSFHRGQLTNIFYFKIKETGECGSIPFLLVSKCNKCSNYLMFDEQLIYYLATHNKLERSTVSNSTTVIYASSQIFQPLPAYWPKLNYMS